MFSKKLFALLGFLAFASPAFADSTIDALTAGGALTGAEAVPMFQTANPAVRTTTGAIAAAVAFTGDATKTLNGTALTLATVNANVGSFGSATNCVAFTTNAKGLITAASQATCTPALASITGFGTGVASALAAALNASTGLVGALTPTNNNCIVGNGSAWTSAACSTGSGTVTSVAAGCGTSASPSPITGSGTISAALTLRSNTAATDTIVSTDCGNVVYENRATSVAVAIAQAGTAGFGSGVFFNVCNINAGIATITPTTSTIGGAATLAIGAGSAAAPTCYTFQSDGTNYNILENPGTNTNASLLSSGTVAAARGGAGTINGALKGNGSGVVSQAACADLSNGTALCSTTPGTGVATAAAANLSAAGGLTTTIASGTASLGTSAISSAACASVVTVTATNTATTDVVLASFNGDPTAVTGYIPATAGMLTIIGYPTANNVNFKVCNNTSSSVTPGAITLNWRVVR